MKEYFNNYKSKLPEYVQMKRIAIKKMRLDKATYREISEIIGLTPTACMRLHKKHDPIHKEIEDKFHSRIAIGHYPMFKNKRIIWGKL